MKRTIKFIKVKFTVFLLVIQTINATAQSWPPAGMSTLQNDIELQGWSKPECDTCGWKARNTYDCTSLITSGTTGDLMWELCSDGTLIISGTGDMPDYPYDGVFSAIPWYNYRESINEVVIKPGVTSIGNCAFINGNITFVDISNTVTRIGDLAFAYQSEDFLKSISIPNSVIIIGDNAFDGCGLTDTIHIPGSVTSIGHEVFYQNFLLTDIIVDTENLHYCSSNGILYSKNKETLITCPNGKTGAMNIPNSVITIGESAFNKCQKINAVTIPESVATIGESAFFDCQQLPSIFIPSGVTAIGGNAFAACNLITAIDVDVANTKYCSIEGILYNKNQDTLVMCPSGKSGQIILPYSVTTINEYAFFLCSKITAIILPAALTNIGYMALSCYNMLTITNLNPIPQILNYLSPFPINLILSNITLYVPKTSVPAYQVANIWKDFGKILPILDTEYTITVVASPTAGGTVSGGGNYHYGDQVLISATPNFGYTFTSWNDGNTDASRTITVTETTTYTATFTSNTYTLTLNSNGGTGAPASIQVTYGQQIGSELVTPTRPGYAFGGWYIGAQLISPTYVWNYTSNQTAVASWSAATYTVTFITAVGTVNPSTLPYIYNTTITSLPTITPPAPAANYQFMGWYIDDVPFVTGVPFLYTENQTTVARWSFAINITNTTPTFGTPASSTGMYLQGTDHSYTFTPNFGYHISSLTVNGVQQVTTVDPEHSDPITLEFNNLSEPKIVSVSYALNCYQHHITFGDGVFIATNPNNCVPHGTYLTYEPFTTNCYDITGITVDGVAQNPPFIDLGTITGPLPLINITSQIKTFTITTTAGANGTISPSGNVTVNCGEDQIFTIMPNQGYHIEYVFVDGLNNPNAVSSGSYTFENVTTNGHTISVTFAPNTYTLTGKVTITGNAGAGETLTANTDSLTSSPVIPDLGVLSYQWKRGSVNIGTNSSTYFILPADIGSTITVTVTAANCAESVTSSPTTTIIGWDPTVILDGQHNVCAPDPMPPDFNTNVRIYAIIDGYWGLDTEKEHYEWEVDGFGYVLSAPPYDLFMCTLPYKSEPYKVRLHYVVGEYGCDVWSDYFLVYVHKKPEVVITATNNEICVGGTTTLTAIFDGANETDFSYQWYKDNFFWENQIPDGIFQSYTTPSINEAGEHTYHVVVERKNTDQDPLLQGICRDVQEITIIVHPKPVIEEITVSETNICQSGQVTVTAILSEENFGNDPVFTWIEDGGNLNDFTGASLKRTLSEVGDHTYNAIVTYQNPGCASAWNTALEETVTVSPNVEPSVSISGNTIICAETSITFTAIPTHGGTNPSYQWKVNNGNVGTNSATFTYNNPVNNAIVSCTMTSNALCVTSPTANSNELVIHKDTRTITASVVGNGTISPSGNVTVNCGENQIFIITPNSGYHIDQVFVDGSPISDYPNNGSYSYTFTNVTANHSISVTFAPNNTFYVTFTSVVGTIPPPNPQGYVYNTTVTNIPTPTPPAPEANYQFMGWFIDDFPFTIGSTFLYDKNQTAVARWSFAINITNNTPAWGTPSSSTGMYLQGTDHSYTFTPNFGYHISSLIANGVQQVTTPDPEHSDPITLEFNNLSEPKIVSVTFALNCYNHNFGTIGNGVTVSPDPNGNCIPHGTTNFAYTLTTNCYDITGITVNGVAQTPPFNTITLGTITGPLPLINITSQIRTYDINVSASPTVGGTVSGGGEKECGASVTVKATPNP
ncbi:MAG: leucine-rich repeat protein, partial [Lentimicrobiaceae bacterium]|nr:leucine-rich repeat protein [Lentimicrobiaceae bacterium]